MPWLEIRVSRDPKFEKNRKYDVFMHIILLDSVLTTQMHFSPTHLVPLLLSTLFGGLASKLSLKDHPFKNKLLGWLTGVKLEDFLLSFTVGEFQGISLNSCYPKPHQFDK